MICYRTDVYTIFIELAYKKGYVFDSVVLDFTKAQLCGKEKATGYKSMRENENKAGYSWRCPKINN